MNNVISVTQLNTYIKQIINAEELLQYIVVGGEVFSISVVSGNAFITIADKDAQIACVYFGINPSFIPKKGDKILVTGGLSYYVKTGKLTFIARKIEPLGQGTLLQKFEELKKKLQAEGLFDESKKRKIEPYARKIVVVTSLTGAVIRDIVTTIRRKNPLIEIYIIDTRVQGETAYLDIIKGLDLADELNVDTVILARGGGSLEDLLPFFDESVVRKVASMNTPIISAIGHETDVSLTDFAADLRSATPTAAGEAVAYNYYETIECINNSISRISNNVAKIYDKKYQQVNSNTNEIVLKGHNFVANNVAKINEKIAKFNFDIINKINAYAHSLDKLTDRIELANPLKLIKKGLYKIEQNNSSLVGIKNLKTGDKLSIFSCEGKINATVDSIEIKVEVKK